MPRKSRSYKERLPWDDARLQFTEDELRAEARTPQSLSNWRELGVPSHAVVRLLRARGLPVHQSDDSRREPEEDPLVSVPQVTHLMELIHADAALDPFTGLPGGQGARERFRDAMAEAERKLAVYAEDLMRALEHRKNELLAEARRPK